MNLKEIEQSFKQLNTGINDLGKTIKDLQKRCKNYEKQLIANGELIQTMNNHLLEKDKRIEELEEGNKLYLRK